MKNIKFYVRCVLKEGIPRKERKTERKERQEDKKRKNEKKEKYRILFFLTSLVSAIIFLYLLKTIMSYSCIL